MSGNRPATEHGNAISVIPGSAAIDNPDNPSSRSSLADTDDSHRSDHDAVDELTTAIQSVSVVDLDRDDAREDEDNADLDLFKSNDQNVGITEKFKGAEPADEYATTKAAVVEAEDVIDCISNSEIEDGTASTFTSSSCSSESDVLSCSSADDADDETATTFSIDDIARMLRDGTFRDVVVMTGAVCWSTRLRGAFYASRTRTHMCITSFITLGHLDGRGNSRLSYARHWPL